MILIIKTIRIYRLPFLEAQIKDWEGCCLFQNDISTGVLKPGMLMARLTSKLLKVMAKDPKNVMEWSHEFRSQESLLCLLTVHALHLLVILI